MREYTQKLHIDAPPERVFAAVVDPANQQSRFMKVELVEETPEGVGTTFRYYYRVLGMRLGGATYSYSEYDPNRRFTWQFPDKGLAMWVTGGPVASTFTFEPANGGTDLTIRPRFKTRIPGVNHLARRILMASWKRGLPDFLAQVEKDAKASARV